jgi:hypothetical protein
VEASETRVLLTSVVLCPYQSSISAFPDREELVQ